VGVMDGAQSDLRTGLPWQMLEIHEPVRLTLAVETTPDALLCILNENPGLAHLVHNRWIALAALDPDGDRIWEIAAASAQLYLPEQPLKEVAGPSLIHDQGQRGHLTFARIGAPTSGGGTVE